MTRKLIVLLINAFDAPEAICQQSVFLKIDSLVSDERYDEARSLINQSAKSNQDNKTIVLLANKTAEIAITQGKLDEAERVLNEIKSQGDRFLEAVTQTNFGFLYLNKARNDLVLATLQQALNKFQESGNANTRESARCLANVTLLYWSTGKLNQAEENGLIALQIRQRLFGESSEEVAASYNDMGLVYSSTDVDKALAYDD